MASVQLHYWPIHLQPYYQRLGFRVGDYPSAETYARTCFSLPLFPSLSQSEQGRVDASDCLERRWRLLALLVGLGSCQPVRPLLMPR